MHSLFIKRSWVEIDLEHIKNNYCEYIKLLPENSEVIAVLKSDAYGHGSIEVAKTLQSVGVNFFAVSNLCEAIELRNADIQGNILILGYTPASFASELFKYNIIQTIVSEQHADELVEYSNIKVWYQFAIDTGMNRIGLNSNDLEHCERTIRNYSKILNINGIFTHFSSADSLADNDVDFTCEQIHKFQLLHERIKDLNLDYVHCSNSAGGLLHTKKFYNAFGEKCFIRLGITLYGLSPNPNVTLPKNILPALSWKSIVSTVKTVKKGEFIGYGRSYQADSDKKIATLAVGYADGYNRMLSNAGYVLINGRYAKIVGRICMDQMTVDVTDIPNVKMGDIATLIGNDGHNIISVDDIAKQTQTINYEVLCNISRRVQRIYDTL